MREDYHKPASASEPEAIESGGVLIDQDGRLIGPRPAPQWEPVQYTQEPAPGGENTSTFDALMGAWLIATLIVGTPWLFVGLLKVAALLLQEGQPAFAGQLATTAEWAVNSLWSGGARTFFIDYAIFTVGFLGMMRVRFEPIGSSMMVIGALLVGLGSIFWGLLLSGIGSFITLSVMYEEAAHSDTQEPPRRQVAGGGIYGRAAPAEADEAHRALNGNKDGYSPLFED